MKKKKKRKLLQEFIHKLQPSTKNGDLIPASFIKIYLRAKANWKTNLYET